MNEDVLNVQGVADLLECSRSTVYGLDLPYRIAGGRKYNKQAVLDWLARGEPDMPVVRPFKGKRRK